MSKALYIILFVCFFNIVQSQSDKDIFIDANIGLGLTTPIESVDIYGEGFYIQGEYVHKVKKWFELRPYVGFITTSKTDNEENPTLDIFEATANIFLIGGKARILAPIPYVGPYIEAGIGANIGNIRTLTSQVDIDKSGFGYHIPLTLGLAIGKNYNFDIAFSYYIHPSEELISGAFSIGYTFEL